MNYASYHAAATAAATATGAKTVEIMALVDLHYGHPAHLSDDNLRAAIVRVSAIAARATDNRELTHENFTEAMALRSTVTRYNNRVRDAHLARMANDADYKQRIMAGRRRRMEARAEASAMRDRLALA